MQCPNCKDDVIVKKGDRIVTKYCPECGVDVQKLLAPNNAEMETLKARNEALETENKTLKEKISAAKSNLP